MPKLNGEPTRKERQAINRQVHAVARKELVDRGRGLTIPDDYKENPKDLPAYVLSGNELRRRRGAIKDEHAVNRVCDLVARGMTESKARDLVGVSSTQWGDWKRANYHEAADKLQFAKKLFLDRKADEIIDIIDDPEILDVPEYDEQGNPLGPTVRDKIALARARCAQRHVVVSALSPEYMPKNLSWNISQNIDSNMTPEEAAERYYKVLEGSPNSLLEKKG